MSTVHLVPVSDGMDHSVPGGYTVPGTPRGWVVVAAVGEAPVCGCGPVVTRVSRDGQDGQVVTHHAADGRAREVAA